MTFLDPRLGAATAITTAVFITAAVLWVARASGPIHQCSGRHEARHRRPEIDEALAARVAENDKRLRDHERQLTGYEKLFAALGLTPPGTARRGGLRLIQGEQHDDDEGRLGRRAGLLSAR